MCVCARVRVRLCACVCVCYEHHHNRVNKAILSSCAVKESSYHGITSMYVSHEAFVTYIILYYVKITYQKILHELISIFLVQVVLYEDIFCFFDR